MALSQISHVRPSTLSAALEIMYRVPPLDLFIQNSAQNAAIRVKPDTSWQPASKAKARVAHGRHLQHQFPAGLWQANTNEITHGNVWEKNYTVQFPTKEIAMLPSDDIDAYTDGSLMGGKSGAGAFILRKSDGKRKHFCSLRGNTKQVTVFQSEVIAVKAAAKALLSNDPSGERIVFHVDNQATLKTLVSTLLREQVKLNPYGVPQGGGLSPILLVIFTADMPEVCTVAQLKLYADDTTGFVVGDSIEDVCQDLEKASEEVLQYMRWNKLSPNEKKTQFLVFHRDGARDIQGGQFVSRSPRVLFYLG
jgi:hypothetical protein